MIIKNKQTSFTLIELLVVIVIIGILAGVIMISTSSSIDKANFAKAQAFSKTVQNELLLNLVSEWTFDEPQIEDTTKDTWGNNDGAVYGATHKTKDLNECIFGGCYNFNGINNYIDCGGNLTITPDMDFTYSVWVKYDSTSWNFVMGGGGSYTYSLYTNHGGEYKPWFYISYEGSVSRYFTGKAWDLNKWHYLVVTRKGDNYAIYQDGSFTKDYTYDTAISLSYLYIGGNDDRKGSGLLDDVRIYNAALSNSQIKQNYIAGLNSMLANGNISKEEYNERINTLAHE